MLLRRPILLCACLTVVTVGAAQACPNHDRTTAQLTRAQAPANAAALVAWKPRAWGLAARPAAAGSQGMRVAIDPLDGTMSMPQEPISTEMLAVGDEAPIRMQRFANGSVSAQLDERFAEFAVVTLGADGKPSWTCVHGAAGASRFMSHPVVVSTPPSLVREDK